MIYGAGHRNKVLQDRVTAVLPFWKKLRSLRVSVWHKLLLIRMALLPRALHASHLTFLGAQWFTGLRTQIMRALRVDLAGASPLIRIPLTFGLDVDPEFFDAWNTFKAFVFYVQRAPFIRDRWDSFCKSSSTKRTFGPFAKFVRLLEQLGWILMDSDQVSLGCGFRLSLRCTDLGVWKPLVEWFWRQRIAKQVSARKDFCDLDGINYVASFTPWKHLDRAKSELLSCIRDGTFYHGVSKSKFDACQHAICSCGLGKDDTPHRALVCPRFQSVREQFLDMVQMWHFLPICMTEHGLCPHNPFQIQYWAALSKIPWDPPAWHGSPPHEGVQYLFVDGSCSDPGQPDIALAGWSVVSADLKRPIGAGLLPGCLHTSNRSEIWALTMAVQWLIDHERSGHLFTDSQYAADGFKFLSQTFAVPSDWADRDLWDALLQRLQIDNGDLEVTKVSAHRSLHSWHDDQSRFITFWNAVADTNAKAARLSGCPNELAEVRNRNQSVHRWQIHWTQRAQCFLALLALQHVQHCSEGVVGHSVQMEPEDELISSLMDACPNQHDWQELFPVTLHDSILRCRALVSFSSSVALTFCHWLLHLDREATHLKSVTFVEAFMGFHLYAGVELPVAGRDTHNQRIWMHMDRSTISELVPRTLKARLDVFTVLFDLVDGWFALSVDRCQLSKPQLGILKSLPGIKIPWPNAVEQRVNGTRFLHIQSPD